MRDVEPAGTAMVDDAGDMPSEVGVGPVWDVPPTLFGRSCRLRMERVFAEFFRALTAAEFSETFSKEAKRDNVGGTVGEGVDVKETSES